MFFKRCAFLILLIAVAVKSDNGIFKISPSATRPCTDEGLMCDDCETLVTCKKNDEGEWEKEITEECQFGRTCSRFTSPHSCTFAQNNECDSNVIDYHHRCSQVGLFPHPFACKKYYNCILEEDDSVNPTPIPMECKNGYGYDSLTTNCRKKLENGECPEKFLLEPCHNVGRIDEIEGNPYMHSICLIDEVQGRKVFFPNIFYCNDDEEFVKDKCVKPDTGLDEEGRCRRIGFFYDPHDCKRYRECLLGGLKPVTGFCLIGFEFNKFSKVCESFNC